MPFARESRRTSSKQCLTSRCASGILVVKGGEGSGASYAPRHHCFLEATRFD